jgi:hypothetical protein
MTTDQPTPPTSDAIDAVARASNPDAFASSPPTYTSLAMARSVRRAGAMEEAFDLLTSTDPDVHAAMAASLPADAMLAELVKRGTLREETREWKQFGEDWVPMKPGRGTRKKAQLRTDWREVAP